MTLRTVAVAVALMLALPGWAVDGWRGDGSGLVAGATPPAALKEATWRVPLETVANASPVMFGGLVVVTEEPSTLVAVDSSTGSVRWRVEHDIAGTFPAAEAAAIRARLATVPALEASLTDARRTYAELRRRQRAGAVDPAELQAVSATLAAAQAELESLARYRSQPTADVVGWASPTPVADDKTVYALFGNGVVVAHGLDGGERWNRWLGPAPLDHRGHYGQDTASPLLVDGLLIVAHGRLSALDPATGATVWQGPRYSDFGTPAVVRVAGRALLACPDGALIDARTGAVVATGLGDVFYTSPIAVGDVVYYAGGTAGHDGGGDNLATAVRLRPDGTGVAVDRLWSTPFGRGDQVFSAPVVMGDRLVVATKARYLHVLDTATGAVVHTLRLEDTGECWAPLVVAGDRVWATSIAGVVHGVALDGPTPSVLSWSLSKSRTTPRLVGSAVFWRAEHELVWWN